MTKKEITDYIETLEKFLVTAFNSKAKEKSTRHSQKLSDKTRIQGHIWTEIRQLATNSGQGPMFMMTDDFNILVASIYTEPLTQKSKDLIGLLTGFQVQQDDLAELKEVDAPEAFEESVDEEDVKE